MKVIAAFVATLSVVAAFAPQSTGSRASTKLNEKFWDKIFGMDLFAPNPDVNDYGARKKKNIKQGQVGANSYVPAGLTLEQYKKIRAEDEAKKSSNYDKNVKKAFKYLGFDEFYNKRGTDLSQSWVKDPTKGHRMAKTKYDYSGKKNEVKNFESAGSIFGKK